MAAAATTRWSISNDTKSESVSERSTPRVERQACNARDDGTSPSRRPQQAAAVAVGVPRTRAAVTGMALNVSTGDSGEPAAHIDRRHRPRIGMGQGWPVIQRTMCVRQARG